MAAETYLGAGGNGGSAYDAAVAAGLVGCAEGLPRDLSTNRQYLEGFGKQK
jgi:hypothetical protein